MQDPDFWSRHIVARGLGAGVGHWLFTCKTTLAEESYNIPASLRRPSGIFSHFRASFVTGAGMGAISGVLNTLLHPILVGVAKGESDEARQGLKFFGNCLPWLGSYLTLSHLQKRGTLQGLYKFDRRADAAIAIWGALCDSSNDDILLPKNFFGFEIKIGGF